MSLNGKAGLSAWVLSRRGQKRHHGVHRPAGCRRFEQLRPECDFHTVVIPSLELSDHGR